MPPAEIFTDGRREPDARLPEFTALPGLIESHAHLFLQGGVLDFEKRRTYLQQSPEELLAQARMRLKPLLALGVMAVRDAGDKDGVGLAISADCKNNRHDLLPYVDSPGAAIHHQGRYGSFMGEPLGNYASPQACVDSRIAAGADRIKLIPTGIVNFEMGAVTTAPQMSVGEVCAFVVAAKNRNKQTFAHSSGADGIENVIAAGLDSIEHGFFVTREQLAKMRDKNIGWVPTFAPVQRQVDHAELMGWSDAVVENLQRILDGHTKSLNIARELGVTIIAGSDAGSCGVAHGLDFIYELELMQQAGMPTLEIVNSATGNSARRLGYHVPIGLLKKDYRARFLLTQHCPLESVQNLRREKFCIFDGALISPQDDFDLTIL